MLYAEDQPERTTGVGPFLLVVPPTVNNIVVSKMHLSQTDEQASDLSRAAGTYGSIPWCQPGNHATVVEDHDVDHFLD
jgi:hypothetical protein